MKYCVPSYFREFEVRKFRKFRQAGKNFINKNKKVHNTKICLFSFYLLYNRFTRQTPRYSTFPAYIV